ncbi:MAG TPA: AbrB/MazE/SpoVT family DNA-binding domain-containing protein [Candidatus Nanoarchaeia archaeon]|nr:AbrB/MazE/SpoVT family DNA-binding domain-containing protein [Candidatus Nanoarchaeia archaeon]
MAEVAVTKMSSKGQVVIPSEMRADIREGEKIIIIKDGDQIIMEKASKFDKRLKEDLIFAKRTAEAFKRYEKGEFVEMSFEEFMKAAKKW